MKSKLKPNGKGLLTTTNRLNAWRKIFICVLILFYGLLIWASVDSWLPLKHNWGITAQDDKNYWQITWLDDDFARNIGLQVGDKIISANGVFPHNSSEINSAGILIVSGKDNVTNTISWNKYNSVDPSPHQILPLINGLIVSLSCFIVGIVVFLHAPVRKQAWAFLSFLVALSATLVLTPVAGLGISWAIHWQEITGGLFGASLGLGFLLAIIFAPTAQKGVQSSKSLKFNRFRNLLWYLWFIPALPGAIIAAIYLYQLKVHDDISLVTNILNLYTLLMLVFMVMVALFGYKYTHDYRTKNQLRWVTSGSVIAVAPFLFLSLLPEQIFGYHLVPTSLTTLSIMALPLTYGYAILRHEWVKVDSFVRRSLIGGLLFFIVLFSSFIVAALFSYNLGTVSTSLVDAFLVFAVIIGAAIFPLASKFSHLVIEAAFFPEIYHYRKMLKLIDSEPMTSLDLDELSRMALGQVRLVLPVKEEKIFILDEKSRNYYAWPKEEENEEVPVQAWTPRHPIVQYAQRNPEDVIPISKILEQVESEEARERLRKWELIVPLVVKGSVVAVLALGHRDDGQPYSGADYEMLPRLIGRFAVQIDHARLYTDLLAAHEQQQELDRLKDQFLATAAHELRTPLTSVYGYLELLADLDETEVSPQAKMFVQTALQASETLTGIVGSLLDTSRLQLDASQFKIEDISLAPEFKTTAEAFALEASRSGRKLNIKVPLDLAVKADRQHLGRVIRNLMANAMKYSPENAPIDVSAEAIPDEKIAVIGVRDYGKGIPPEHRDVIFAKFVRLERDLNSPVRGAGLGLFICKQLVEMMGGKLWVESAGIPGEGSEFKFSLPLAEPDSEKEASAA